MFRPYLLLMTILSLLCTILPAQEPELLDRRESLATSFARIEKALAAIEQNMKDDDAEVKELLVEVRRATKALEARVQPKMEPPQILFWIAVIDLDAKDAMAAWTKNVGPVTEGLTKLPSTASQLLVKMPGLISAPQILVSSGQRAELTIGEEKDYSYLRRREGDVFVVDKTKLRDGLELRLHSEIQAGGRHATKLHIEVTRIIGKTELSAESQTVGMPLTFTKTSDSRIEAPLGTMQALRIRGDSGHGIMVVIHADTNRYTSEKSGR